MAYLLHCTVAGPPQQVYNEQVFDLLEDAPVGPGLQRAALRLKEDSQGRVFVAGLNEVRQSCAWLLKKHLPAKGCGC